MSARETFRQALTHLSQAYGPEDDLCLPFLTVLPVLGAAVSTLGDPLGSATVCASDTSAARLDEIQIDLGEGPCWDAMTSGRPVLESDLQGSAGDRWPIASTALRETGIAAVFAFPLVYGRLSLGAIDFYGDRSARFDADDIDDASALAGVAARQVFHRAMDRLDAPGSDDLAFPREAHQASGMMSVQLDIPVDDALLILRGHAYATSRSVREVAADVVSRRLDFSE
ncbi:GAF and ANTAR domain-containing protein [Frondihabitans cladoniiphilus]|uniref:GAF domain-containing protein n=1 Tax=Frondihabitans cladoniiphilus TaxID=715785 RepID=A0ABP8W657_9MICO